MTCFLSKHDASRDEYLGKIKEMTDEIFLHTKILKSNRAAILTTSYYIVIWCEIILSFSFFSVTFIRVTCTCIRSTRLHTFS